MQFKTYFRKKSETNYFCNKIYLTDDNPRRESPKIIRNQTKAKINKKKLVNKIKSSIIIYVGSRKESKEISEFLKNKSYFISMFKLNNKKPM